MSNLTTIQTAIIAALRTSTGTVRLEQLRESAPLSAVSEEALRDILNDLARYLIVAFHEDRVRLAASTIILLPTVTVPRSFVEDFIRQYEYAAQNATPHKRPNLLTAVQAFRTALEIL